MNETSNDTPPRHAGRRNEDPNGLWRHPWFRKLVAGAVALLTPMAMYFWNESRGALRDIQAGQAGIVEVRYELQKLKYEVAANNTMSDAQRTDLKENVARVEAKVDRLDERLSKWFERATRQ